MSLECRECERDLRGGHTADCPLEPAWADLVRAARSTVDWLDNIAAKMGQEAMIDQMPNNFGGRVALRAAIAKVDVEEY